MIPAGVFSPGFRLRLKTKSPADCLRKDRKVLAEIYIDLEEIHRLLRGLRLICQE